MSLEHHLVLGEMTLAPAAEWSPNITDWALFRVATGLGYFHRAGETQELAPGDSVGVPTGVGALFRASRLSKMRLQYFQVHLEFLSGLLTPPERHSLDALFRHSTLGIRLLSATHPVAVEFGELCTGPGPQGSLVARFGLLRLFTELFSEDLVPHRLEPVLVMRAPERFEKLFREMPDSELAARSLADLASKCGCSERHFSRLFRQYLGVSLRAKQTELRLERARHLLVESDAKVIHVALECGYRHLGLFNTMFKKKFGMTPTDWRREAARRSRQVRSGVVRRIPTRRTASNTGYRNSTDQAWIPLEQKAVSSLIQSAAS